MRGLLMPGISLVISLTTERGCTTSENYSIYGLRFSTVQGRRWELRNGGAFYAREARENFSELIKIHDGRG